MNIRIGSKVRLVLPPGTQEGWWSKDLIEHVRNKTPFTVIKHRDPQDYEEEWEINCTIWGHWRTKELALISKPTILI